MKELTEIQNEAHEAYLADLADAKRYRQALEMETKEQTKIQEKMAADYRAEFANTRMHRKVTTFLNFIHASLLAIFLVVYIYRG